MRALATLVAAVIGLGVANFAFADDNDGDDAPRARPSAYPENLVKADGSRIRSGCLPGIMELAGKVVDAAPTKYGWIGKLILATHFLDRPSYSFEVGYGERVTYKFNFTRSCNLHDAGYEAQYYGRVDGGLTPSPLVYDQVFNQYVDYTNMSRDAIDQRFLADMRQECVTQLQAQLASETDQYRLGQLKRGAKEALSACQGNGRESNWPTWGAASLYEITQKYGDAFYRR
ncbi:MAG TPA: hypothetical protein VMJ10_21820 [Kofleriaceae bacterium]|nr:hypothetical protein [Kofleriaceae bacterium]